MDSNKNIKPLGLKITQFITTNIFWYFLFSFIFWDFNLKNWWLIESIWGRIIIVFLEIMFLFTSFIKDDNEKS